MIVRGEMGLKIREKKWELTVGQCGKVQKQVEVGKCRTILQFRVVL